MTPDFGKLLSGVFDLVVGAIVESAVAPETEARPAKRNYRSIVKLIHAEELGGLAALPRYQDFVGIRLDEYERERDRIDQLKHDHDDVIATLAKSIELDRGELTSYEDFSVVIAPFFWRKLRRIALPPPKYQQTVVTASEGQIVDGELVVRAGWLKRKTVVKYECPMRIRHREELESLENKISKFTTAENQAIDEIANSRFAHPVLFISHRWESAEHPDPGGQQLEKLRALKDCFLIYDYISFPQKPLSDLEANDLDIVLKNMGSLIRNVIVMDHPNYAKRGWCIYEYIAACFEGSFVCDEIADPRFVALRDWVATRVIAPRNMFHDGAESMMSNHKQEAILSTVNEILPSFKASEFTVNSDREIVKWLLTNLLQRKLPPKRYHRPETGIYESSSSPWTDEELKDAFDGELRWDKLDTMPMEHFRLDVASSLPQAVDRRYKVETKETFTHLIYEMENPFAAFLSTFTALFRKKEEHPAFWDAIRARRKRP